MVVVGVVRLKKLRGAIRVSLLFGSIFLLLQKFLTWSNYVLDFECERRFVMEKVFDYSVWTYSLYLLLSLGLTVWVGRTLFRHGRVFVIDACRQNEPLADAVNRLLVVGFYLVNIGFVTLALKYGTAATSTKTAFEFVSTKVGLVLVVLGGMHFFNLYLLTRVRRRGLAAERRAQDAELHDRLLDEVPPISADGLV